MESLRKLQPEVSGLADGLGNESEPIVPHLIGTMKTEALFYYSRWRHWPGVSSKRGVNLNECELDNSCASSHDHE